MPPDQAPGSSSAAVDADDLVQHLRRDFLGLLIVAVLPQGGATVIAVASQPHPFVKPAAAGGVGEIQRGGPFGQQRAVAVGDDFRDSRATGGVWR
jgi:hypothetical protein